MSHEHDQTSLEASAIADEIHPEPAPFEPGYHPETLPKLTVPDLADDAEGLSAEALANVPTLTELVETQSESVAVPAVTAVEEAVELQPSSLQETLSSANPEPVAQAEPPQTDTWTEELHVRMGKLTDDIHSMLGLTGLKIEIRKRFNYG